MTDGKQTELPKLPLEVATSLSGKVWITIEHKTASMAFHQVCEMSNSIPGIDPKATAKFIVHRVNTFDSLLKAAKEMYQVIQILNVADLTRPTGMNSTVLNWDKAIKEAEAGK